MRTLFSILRGFALFGLAFIFLKWYIKGHFGKYFLFFWLWSIISFSMYYNHKKEVEESYDHRTGAEIWEERYGK